MLTQNLRLETEIVAPKRKRNPLKAKSFDLAFHFKKKFMIQEE
jgi:hypothetical protein